MPPQLRAYLPIMLACCCALGGMFNNGTAARADERLAATSALEAALFEDMEDSRLDEFSLLSGALIAGGVQTQEELAKFQRVFDRHAQTLAEHLDEGDEHTYASLFEHLHTMMLTGEYRLDCSNVAESLATGDYNCLSGTVLFMVLAQRANLPTIAVAAENHVLCRQGDAKEAYIESTCDCWFTLDPSQRTVGDPAQATEVETTRRAVELRDMSDTQLIAKVYYNRGVALLRQGRHEAGLRLTQAAVKFDPIDDVARGNLLAGINNWALRLTADGKFAAAIEKLDQLQAIDDDYGTLRENRWHVYRSWARSLCKQQRFDEAFSILQRGQDFSPSPAEYTATLTSVEKKQHDVQPTPVAAANHDLTHDGS